MKFYYTTLYLILLLLTCSTAQSKCIPKSYAEEDMQIIALGIDLTAIELSHSVHVAASIVSKNGSIENEIEFIPNFVNIELKYINQQLAGIYQNSNSACCARAGLSAFQLVNNDTNGDLFLGEKLIDLFRQIKFTTEAYFGFINATLHATVVVPITANQGSADFRLIATDAVERAGLRHHQLINRHYASLETCSIEQSTTYALLFHVQEETLTVSVLEGEESYLYDILSTKAFNYKDLQHLGIFGSIPTIVDDLIKDSEYYNQTDINRVIITSSPSLTVKKQTLPDKIRYFFKQDAQFKHLTHCESFGRNQSYTIPHDAKIVYGAVRRGVRIAPDQIFVWDNDIVNYVNLNPMNFGVEVAGGLMHPVLKRHYVDDGAKSVVFTTSVNGQRCIEVRMYRGFRSGAKNNTYIGTLYLNDIQKRPQGVPRIRVTIDALSNFDVLNVTILDEQTGQYNNTVFKNDYEEMVSEMDDFEKDFSVEEYEQNRAFDNELQIKILSLISEYVVPRSNLRDTVFKMIKYLWLPKQTKREIDQLKLQSRNKLTLLIRGDDLK